MVSASHLTRSIVTQLMGLQGLDPNVEADQATFLKQWPSKAKSFSHAPYSNFVVGAAAFLSSGDIMLGANFEYGNDLVQTIHAEQSVIIQALALDLHIEKIAISGIPCGFCRQSLFELAGSEKIEVFLGNGESCFLPDLFPRPFGPKDLGQFNVPPQHARRQVVIDGAWEKIPTALQRGLSAALSRSYSPWARSEAAVAVETNLGEVVFGSYFENAAFNPSVSAMRAAIVQLAHLGRGPIQSDTIDRVWLAHTKQGRIDHIGQTNFALTGLGCSAKVHAVPTMIR